MIRERTQPRRVVSASSLAMLRAQVRGRVVTPDDDDYDGVRSIWNRAAECTPALIVRCAWSADVASAIEFARGAHLPIAVRGGGYSPAGMCSCNGLVLDLRPMRAVRVDPLGRVAVVGAGATWGRLDGETQRFGYAVPGALLSGIGVAGSTLGGAFGHLRRAYGLACDSLVSADLVTADGRLLTTNGDLHPELLWGLRGGGGNFGVVTSLRFRLRPLPGPVLSGSVVYPAAEAARVLEFYAGYTERLREDVSTQLILYAAPPDSPGRRQGRSTVVITAACVGRPEDAERLVRPIRTAAPTIADRLSPRPYVELQRRGHRAYPPGRYAAMTSCFVSELPDELVAALRDAQAAMPPGAHEIHVHHMGGAVGRVARMSTAVPNRAAPYLISLATSWTGVDDESACRGWMDAAAKAITPFAVGGPHIGLHSEPVSSVDAYGAERYLRLAALKRSYDPDNVFAGNQNVVPLP